MGSAFLPDNFASKAMELAYYTSGYIAEKIRLKDINSSHVEDGFVNSIFITEIIARRYALGKISSVITVYNPYTHLSPSQSARIHKHLFKSNVHRHNIQ